MLSFKLAAMATPAPVEVTDICCIGAGYVGAITMTIIAQHCPELRIVVVDVNQAKIDQWNSDDLPLFEPGLKEIIVACRGTHSRLAFGFVILSRFQTRTSSSLPTSMALSARPRWFLSPSIPIPRSTFAGVADLCRVLTPSRYGIGAGSAYDLTSTEVRLVLLYNASRLPRA